MKPTLSTLIGVLLLTEPVAQGQFIYETNHASGSILITRYTGSGGDVTIPKTITDLPVTAIYVEVFQDHTNITGLAIPDSVTSIGYQAFARCSLLGSITIPGSVSNLAEQVLEYCRGLTNATLANGVTTIPAETFYSCANLATVTIANGVTNIGQQAFAYCSALNGIAIPDTVTSVGFQAFSYCSNLGGITIPGGVTNLGFSAFEFCTSLTNVTIANGVTAIPPGTFSSCSNLVHVTIPDSVTNIAVAFESCTRLTSITIPAGVATVGGTTFYSCSNLAGVYFKGNAPALPDESFVSVFRYATNAIVYYLPGTTGWSSTFSGRPTVLWNPKIQTENANFGVRNNQFGFDITGTNNFTVVVESTTNLTNPVWSPLQTVTLTNGLFHFSESVPTNRLVRFYRLSPP